MNYIKILLERGSQHIHFQYQRRTKKEWKHIDNLKIFSLLAIVEDEKIHPASTTHSQMSDEELKDMEIVQNILSISIGAEHIDDIITDLENGLDAIKEN